MFIKAASISAWIAAVVTLGLVSEGASGAADARFDRVEFTDMPDEFVDMANWAVGLFDEAELALPPIRFAHHGDDTSYCAGWLGAHRHVDDHSRIDICTSNSGKPTEALVLHELAHAWAAHDLSDERKSEFQSLRGWTHWSNHAEVAWHENGTEQAAEIMVWGLIDRPVGIITIHDHSCDELEAGFRTLTGRAPLHGFRDHC